MRGAHSTAMPRDSLLLTFNSQIHVETLKMIAKCKVHVDHEMKEYFIPQAVHAGVFIKPCKGQSRNMWSKLLWSDKTKVYRFGLWARNSVWWTHVPYSETWWQCVRKLLFPSTDHREAGQLMGWWMVPTMPKIWSIVKKKKLANFPTILLSGWASGFKKLSGCGTILKEKNINKIQINHTIV